MKNRFKILLEYRANFMIGAASTVMMQTAGLLTIWVVMSQVPSLKGCSLPELWLIYGLITLALCAVISVLLKRRGGKSGPPH